MESDGQSRQRRVAEFLGDVVRAVPRGVEISGLVSFADVYKSRGVETIGVTFDEDLSLVAPFVEKYAIKYPSLTAGFDPNASGEIALPTTFLYNKTAFGEKIHGHCYRIHFALGRGCAIS